jgi:hypothetical protein
MRDVSGIRIVASLVLVMHSMVDTVRAAGASGTPRGKYVCIVVTFLWSAVLLCLLCFVPLFQAASSPLVLV